MRKGLLLLWCLLIAVHSYGQTTKPDDGPSIKVGAQIFADYTYGQEPLSIDADGNRVHPSAFNMTRAYLNVTGNLTHSISFRVTPDIARESGTGSSLAGSQTFRLKFAYAQFNPVRWASSGTSIRFGMQPTPFMEYIDPIYRYRFQGALFEDREGFESTADTGIAARTTLPGRVELQGGIFNGEGFSKAETNNQKSVQLRATWKPFPTGVGSGLRLTGYVHDDHYLERAARQRLIAQAVFTHPGFTAGFDYLATKDQQRTSLPEIDGRGFTVWLTPRLVGGWEALLRHDEFRPDSRSSATKKRDIEGLAYWFPLPKGLSTALMLDRDSTRGIGPRITNWGVKMLVNF
jgi:Phosphate-selective porin O and P